MKDIKTREHSVVDIKTVDRVANLGARMKQAAVRSVEKTQNLAEDGQASPSEYAGDKLQYGIEDAVTEGGHMAVDTVKGGYQTGKRAVQQYKKKQQEKILRQQEEMQHGEPDPVAEQPVSEQTIPVPEADSHAAGAHPHGHTADVPTAGADISSPMTTRASNHAPKELNTASPAKSDSTPKSADLRRSRNVPKRTQSIKIAQRSNQAIKQTATSAGNATIKTAEGTVKGSQRAIKTAEQSSKMAIKTAQASAKAIEKGATAAARTAVRAKQIAIATAKATATAAKAAAKAIATTVKAIIAAAKELIAAIAAGGWVAVLIVVVIVLVALIVGSVFGIFFSSEDTGSSMTMREVVQEINVDYQNTIDSIRYSTTYDNIEATGSRAVWPEVLAVYAIKVNYDPDNPQEVASMDDAKKATLEQIFWAMNEIDYYTQSHEEIEVIEVPDEDGNIVETETTVTVTTLYLTVSHKTAEEMADEYGFTDAQKELLAELLQDENATLWSAVLYGIHNPDEQIVAVAASQIGNVGGQPYWSWYGFGERVAWCACFVSWCANECGYIDMGIIPKFAGCGYGADWFIERGQWADGSYTPQPGDIIFFDWDDEEGQDGTRDHVGIVEKVEDGYVHTIEGNTSDSCARRRYPVGHYEIIGYGLPAY